MAIRVTLPEKDEDMDGPSPAESLQMSVSTPLSMDRPALHFMLGYVIVINNQLGRELYTDHDVVDVFTAIYMRIRLLVLLIIARVNDGLQVSVCRQARREFSFDLCRGT